MTPLMMTLRASLFATIGATMFVLAPAAANAAQCRQTVDDDGDAVTMCGSVAYYDDEDDDDDDADEDGSLFVDVEDCEPGKFWMLETLDDEGDVDYDMPMACK